jgi:hypothetical protein
VKESLLTVTMHLNELPPPSNLLSPGLPVSALVVLKAGGHCFGVGSCPGPQKIRLKINMESARLTFHHQTETELLSVLEIKKEIEKFPQTGHFQSA